MVKAIGEPYICRYTEITITKGDIFLTFTQSTQLNILPTSYACRMTTVSRARRLEAFRLKVYQYCIVYVSAV